MPARKEKIFSIKDQVLWFQVDTCSWDGMESGSQWEESIRETNGVFIAGTKSQNIIQYLQAHSALSSTCIDSRQGDEVEQVMY